MGWHVEHTAPAIPETHPALFVERTRRKESEPVGGDVLFTGGQISNFHVFLWKA